MCTKEDVFLRSREDKNISSSLELPDFVADSIKMQFKKYVLNENVNVSI